MTLQIQVCTLICSENKCNVKRVEKIALVCCRDVVDRNVGPLPKPPQQFLSTVRNATAFVERSSDRNGTATETRVELLHMNRQRVFILSPHAFSLTKFVDKSIPILLIATI